MIIRTLRHCRMVLLTRTFYANKFVARKRARRDDGNYDDGDDGRLCADVYIRDNYVYVCIFIISISIRCV